MSDFFEIFNPGLRYTREQQDAEKMLVVRTDQGGAGPRPLISTRSGEAHAASERLSCGDTRRPAVRCD